MSTSFTALKLSPAMLRNLYELKYTVMTPIQQQSIPSILEKKDVMAQAKTGSGKTAAFGIGLLENMDTSRYRVQSLILCPTRELAEQVTGELRRLARFQHNIKLVTLTGGVPIFKQEHSLAHQAHIAVGTPGRVLKLLQKEKLSLREVKTIVLDDADRMLEMGFIDQVEEIISYAPKTRQTLCFSATFPQQIKKLSNKIQNNPIEITVDISHDTGTIDQHFYKVPSGKKAAATLGILSKYLPESTIIFCNTKDACRKVRSELNKAGLHSLALHGDLDQKERTESLIRFANGSSRVLVATDVAARGLDINDLSAVINYDLPFESETYVHRVGRTGRAGKEGLAFSLMAPGEEFRIEGINNEMNSGFRVKEPDFTFGATTKELEPSMITVSINGGRKAKISPGDILGSLTAKGGIKGSDVGKIDRQDYLTFVAIKRAVVEDALAVLEDYPIKGRKFLALIND